MTIVITLVKSYPSVNHWSLFKKHCKYKLFSSRSIHYNPNSLATNLLKEPFLFTWFSSILEPTIPNSYPCPCMINSIDTIPLKRTQGIFYFCRFALKNASLSDPCPTISTLAIPSALPAVSVHLCILVQIVAVFADPLELRQDALVVHATASKVLVVCPLTCRDALYTSRGDGGGRDGGGQGICSCRRIRGQRSFPPFSPPTNLNASQEI
jgi:hypothetical protein